MESEAVIVERAKIDPETFGVLYDQNFDRIYRYLQGRTGSREIAEDLTAETFLIALKNLWRFRWTGRPFSAWLYRIALAQVGNFYRRQRKEKTIGLELAEELPDLKAARTPTFNDDYAPIHRALEQLSPPQREAIVLRYFEELSNQEIARTMEIPENTVKSHLHRGLDHLRHIFATNPYGSEQPQCRGAAAPSRPVSRA